MSKTKSGFTIIELLIVIVVIGILAAITIVAYNGIQQRARAGSVSSALSQVAKKIALYRVDNPDTYPGSLSAAGVTNSSDVSYQYSFSSNGYCVTATNGTVSYNATESAGPREGSCMGHSSGGVALAHNFIANPSFETNLTGWDPTWAGATLTRVTSGAGIVAGGAALEAAVGTPNAAGTGGTVTGLQSNTAYVASVYITLISGDPANLMIHSSDGAGTRSYSMLSPVLAVGETRRINLAWTSSANAASTTVTIMRNGASSGGAVIRLDAAMVESGSSVTAYSEL